MNQHIRTIAILGAGAVGSYLVMGLSDKYKENLWVIADGERKDRLAKNGLNINDKVYSLHVKTPGRSPRCGSSVCLHKIHPASRFPAGYRDHHR